MTDRRVRQKKKIKTKAETARELETSKTWGGLVCTAKGWPLQKREYRGKNCQGKKTHRPEPAWEHGGEG